jgi:phosphopantothenoylcysteine decarboxylase/phosphopantothenate--cysteine ligase
MVKGKRIILGVSGGIAAYKAADLTSKLVQAGAVVDVVMTAGAQHFIQPATFNALTRRPVHSAIDAPWDAAGAGHVTLAGEADALLIVPATANTIARLALGLVDDMLTAVALATQAPIVIAPAMEHHMWHHPATQGHLATLKERGVRVIEPESGRLASGASGDGRLADVGRIVAALGAIFAAGPLRGRRVVVTAGGTREAIDPVRFIGNRSSGRMGVELASAASRLGADVTLVAAHDVAVPDMGLHVVRIESALELQRAVEESVVDADVLIMAAAVADFRPVSAADQKIKKRPGEESMSIELTKNPDIIAGIDQPGLLKVGFAAETERLTEYATKKLRDKGLAMIVANDAVATIGAESSEATLLFPDGSSMEVPRGSKREVADAVLAAVVTLLGNGDA